MNADEAVRHLLPMAMAMAGCLAACAAAQAQDMPGYPSVEALDLREVAMLPHYCIYTQVFRDHVPGGNDSATVNRWYAELGTPFHALHHYCFGLMKSNRALLFPVDERTRRFYLADAVSEYDYVITRVPASFVLLPEILTKKANNLVLLGKGPVAVYEFERAIELRNDYWPPYAYMSDYYKEAGNTKKAREVLEAGLLHAPDAKGLQRRLAELDSATSGRSSKR